MKTDTLLYAMAGVGLMSVHGPMAFQIANDNPQLLKD